MWHFEHRLRPDTGFLTLLLLNIHSAVHCASEMSHAHSVLIRGLSSIYRQAAHVHTPQDIRDFVFFCSAWAQTVQYHHDTEENTLFPALEDFTKQPGIMEGNMQQHEAFLPAMHTFRDRVQNTRAEEYSSESIKALVDGFAPALTEHLRLEFDTLLGLDGYDSAELMGSGQ
jgi:hemerythrin-like domain-containing protein